MSVRVCCTNVCCTNVGLDYKLYKKHGTYIKIDVNNFDVRPMLDYYIICNCNWSLFEILPDEGKTSAETCGGVEWLF